MYIFNNRESRGMHFVVLYIIKIPYKALALDNIFMTSMLDHIKQ
jgi:hypothetical protein